MTTDKNRVHIEYLADSMFGNPEEIFPKALKNARSSKIDELRKTHPNLLIICPAPKDWNDFDWKTRLQIQCYLDDEESDGFVKILFAEQSTLTPSKDVLDGLFKDGFSTSFPIEKNGISYISSMETYDIYEKIKQKLDVDAVRHVAEDLHDAGYNFIQYHPNGNTLRLQNSEGFNYSLMRGKTFAETKSQAQKIFEVDLQNISDLNFNFKDQIGISNALRFKFNDPKDLFPYDVNILVGSNGTGKSFLMQEMIKDLLGKNEEDHYGFLNKSNSNINCLIAVSYSPFENYPADSKDSRLIYKHFGFSKESVNTFSLAGGKEDAARNLVQCLIDDKDYGDTKNWLAKLQTMESTLKIEKNSDKFGINFDYVAVEVKSSVDVEDFFVEKKCDTKWHFKHEEHLYIVLSSDSTDSLNDKTIKQHLISSSGVVFLKNKAKTEVDPPVEYELVSLSSGQKIYSQIIICILGAIERNSLIFLDEPELFLHPALEITLIGMLKEVLRITDSKAIVATHSVVTVREIPRACVHVLAKEGNSIFVNRPPFETFGGDIQRIASYVFGSEAVSNPYEKWLAEKRKEFTPEELIEKLGNDITEELMVKIYATKGK
ncbi:MAG: AAA family ATPase [Gallionella sp.]|nr:AAA family ATPase [Gallionella sp.]